MTRATQIREKAVRGQTSNYQRFLNKSLILASMFPGSAPNSAADIFTLEIHKSLDLSFLV
jgi:hypothetical protein